MTPYQKVYDHAVQGRAGVRWETGPLKLWGRFVRHGGAILMWTCTVDLEGANKLYGVPHYVLT